MSALGSNQKRILVADDEEIILGMFREILEGSENEDMFAEASEAASQLYGKPNEEESKPSFELVTCRQGEEAVKAVEEALEEGRPFSVAFIDVRMPPGLSGDVVAKMIHDLDPCLNIVIVTAYSDVSPQQISKNFKIPARLFYIKKPFHWDEIFQFAVALSNNWEIFKELKNQYEMMEEMLIEESSNILHSKHQDDDSVIENMALYEELKDKSRQIEDVNTAMRVLLKEKERDKRKIEEDIAFNINQYVAPYLAKLRQSGLAENQEALVTTIENNLLDVTSAFSGRRAPKRLNFTPMELQVAKLIKHGSSSKDIAEILSLSPLTVESYRRNIRKKMGLTQSKENLRSWLLQNF